MITADSEKRDIVALLEAADHEGALRRLQTASRRWPDDVDLMLLMVLEMVLG